MSIHYILNQIKLSLLRVLLIAVAGLLLPPLAAYGGEIRGTASLPSERSGFRPISPFARSRTTSVNIKSANTIIVYLEESPGLTRGNPPAIQPVMDQKNYSIVPHLLTIVAGTTVRFPNSDDVFHNLFSLSAAKKFDLGRYPNGVSKEVRFEKAGDIRIYCDIHPTMSGVILVVPNKFHTTANEAGEFELSDVPAGTYTICGWHELYPKTGTSVKVPETGTVEVRLQFDLP
ncbi:MAG: hypothetical protein OEM52_01495 [bacterium]|nr:hypothetical protein [bacterium]